MSCALSVHCLLMIDFSKQTLQATLKNDSNGDIFSMEPGIRHVLRDFIKFEGLPTSNSDHSDNVNRERVSRKPPSDRLRE